MTNPLDQHDRDRARTHTTLSMALSAGAGAGKTSVLVDRICRVLEGGVAPRRLAAITFTEAAAGEARARIRDVLERRITESSGSERPVLERARAELGQMLATTIHAFALRLLEDEALEGGWSPGRRLADGTLGVIPVQPSVRAWRLRLHRDAPEAASALSEIAPMTLERGLLDVARFRDLSPRWADDGELLPDGTRLFEIVDEIHDLAALCANPECRLLLHTAELRARLPRGERPGDLLAVLDGLELGRAGNKGRTDDWPGGRKGRMVRLVAQAIDEIDGLRGLAGQRLHRAVIEHAHAHFLDLLSESKRAQGIADFDDILFAADELLRTSAAARRRLHARFDQILIDEVQDTDPLQASIVGRLAREPHHEGPWNAEPLVAGRVFAVGDAKQSIFRFRRADHATWHRIRQLIDRSGAQASLTTNFRSVPGIVDFVNAAFRDLPAYEPLLAHREPASLDPVVMLRSERDHETEAVVRYVHALKNAPHARVVDREDRSLRPLEWRDFLVVLPAWSEAEDLQDAFTAAGVPSYVSGGASFFRRDEVRVGLAALRALEEPGDAEAVVGVLRGLSGCSFEDLAHHRKLGGSWRYTMDPPSDSPCRSGLLLLRRLREQRAGSSLVPLLDELLDETGATAVWSLQVRGLSIQANLDKLRFFVRELEQTTSTPGEVVARLTELARRFLGSEEELPVRPFQADAVEITSVFRAKGREAPVVLLPHWRRKKDSPTAVVDRASNRVSHRLGPLEPPGWKDAKESEKAEDREERRRWVYVAATRARDQLVFCWDDGRETDDRYDLMGLDVGRSIESAAAEVRGLADGAEIALPDSSARVVVRDGDSLPSTEEQTSRFTGHALAVEAALGRGTGDLAAGRAEAEAVSARFAETRKALVQSARRASTIWRSVKDVATQRMRRRGGQIQPGSGTGAGAEVGTVVHRVLEAVDLRAPAGALADEARAELEVQSRLEGLPSDDHSKAERLLQEILRHPVLDRVRAAPEVWHETPFAHPVEGRPNHVVNGVIDLCFPTDEDRTHWVVVDWKTDRPPPGSPAHEIYREQLALYAAGFLRTWLGHRIDVSTELVGPVDDVDPWTEALEDAEPAVHRLLETLRAAGAPAPTVGDELAGGRLVAELAWKDRQLAVLLNPSAADLAIEVPGWTVLPFHEGDDPTPLLSHLVR